MTGFELVLLILGVLGLLSVTYFAAWWYCNGVQLQKKEGHYVLDDDEPIKHVGISSPKLYTGLDTVDEAKNVNLELECSEGIFPSAPESTQHYFTYTEKSTASTVQDLDKMYKKFVHDI